MRIFVTRLPGDNLAPESLIDPLATQQDVCVKLGQGFIYDSATYSEYTIRIPYRGPVYPADEVSVYDNTLGENFVAVVTEHNIYIAKDSSGPVKIWSILTVRRILLDG